VLMLVSWRGHDVRFLVAGVLCCLVTLPRENGELSLEQLVGHIRDG
jgi:hypothetical protein